MVRTIQIGIVVLILLGWESYSRLAPGAMFFFSAPSKVIQTAFAMMVHGSLLRDLAVTTFEAGVGFLIGMCLGTITGIAFGFSRSIRLVAYPFVVALGSVPIFAVSPLIIIWFGIGFGSKVALAVLASYFIATFNAYQGVANVDARLQNVLTVLGASRLVSFRKAVIPSGVNAAMEGARVNVGFAFAGAFIGEVISSEVGLGHATMVAMGLFDMSRVIVGVMCFAGLAIAANALIDQFGSRVAHALITKL
jgi:NitT/TauT family transport system permease protein